MELSTADALKQRQSELKQTYLQNPISAKGTLTAIGVVVPERLECRIVQPSQLNPAGLHPMGGGDGSCQCPVEIMLAGLVSCAGVTLAAVAHAMKLEIRSAEIRVEGQIDFCGTLAVNRQSPVGLTGISVNYIIDSPADDATVNKLLELVDRYCVVWQTFQSMPPIQKQLTRV